MSLDKNHLRIRNDTKITQLNIPKEKIDRINKIILHPNCSIKVAHDTIKDLSGFSPCCICRIGIPTVKLSYTSGSMKGAIEFYCDPCLAKVFEREKDEPTDPDALADYYNCVRGDWHVPVSSSC